MEAFHARYCASRGCRRCCCCRIEVTGIYRATPVRVNPRNRTLHQLYRTYIDVVHYRFTDAKRIRVNRHDVGPDEFAVKCVSSELPNTRGSPSFL